MIDAHLHFHSLSAFAGAVAARVHGIPTLDGRPATPQCGTLPLAWAMSSNGRGITQ